MKVKLGVPGAQRKVVRQGREKEGRFGMGGGVGRCKRADRAEAQPGIWDIAFLQREPLRLISRGMI